MENQRKPVVAAASKESSSALEREWHAFAGLVDDKLLLPSDESRKSGRDDCSKRSEDRQSHDMLSRTKKRHVSETERRASREKSTVTNKAGEGRSVMENTVPLRYWDSGRMGGQDRRDDRVHSPPRVDSTSSCRNRRTRTSDNESDSSHGRHKRRKSHDRYKSERKQEDNDLYHHRHHRARSRERHHSRERTHRSRSGARRTERHRTSSRSSHCQRNDDERTHRSHHQSTRSRRRSRSNSTDRYKIQEETMQKLMKLANDGQLDLTKISLSEVMKTIVVPREFRHNQQHAMRYQMAQLTERIEQLTGVKIPSFYCTGAVNPLVYAEQMRKRKLLWSGKSSQSTSTAKVGIAMTEGQDEKTAEKFRKLLGIRDQSAIKDKVDSTDIMKRQNEAFEALDREYELARLATHTHRGTGLGFLSAPSTSQAPPARASESGDIRFLSESGHADKDRRHQSRN